MREKEVSPELEEQLRLEERASRIRRAVLSDRDFMAGVEHSRKAEQNGETGRPWLDVKRDLGIV